MYDFIGLNEQQKRRWLPSVAMIFNGRLFEDELEGYQTLTVAGRESVSYNFNTSGSINGRDGELPIGKNLVSRTITVKFKLEGNTSEEFQVKIRRLIELLHSEEEVPIQFRDELDVVYYGQFSAMIEIPEDRNNIVATFELFCSDPWKYEGEIVYQNNPSTVMLGSIYQSKPSEIEITLNSDTSKITVDNNDTGRHIILNGDYNAGDVVRINIPNNDITQNRQNIMNNLDYTQTDFHRFMVKTGDSVQVTPQDADMTLKVQSRWK